MEHNTEIYLDSGQVIQTDVKIKKITKSDEALVQLDWNNTVEEALIYLDLSKVIAILIRQPDATVS